MVEFSDDLSTVFDGAKAISRKIETRLKHSLSDIPYYERGVDINEFTYGSSFAAIKIAFRDLGAEVKYNSGNNRVQYYDIEVPVNLEVK